MINAVPSEGSVAGEAHSGLNVLKDGPHDAQMCAFASEQELMQVGLLSQTVGVVASDVLRPGSLH